ncbi:MAG: C39 family peptidase [Candidatus Woesebacteria bacterium]|nr:C39 family peptidase [Candidatus Woesebacteria bacterium]
MNATKNDESKYQSLLAQAKAQLSAFRSFVISQGGASILSNQTKCDSWGCYYNQRDSQWGNMSLGGSPYSVAEYGCLVSSVSMVASHYGKNVKPSDIAVAPNAFVPGTGYLYHSFSANVVNITINSASKSILDGELAAGRPVIAGLFGGPDHFIVITRKDGDSYIMRDPFMENGAGNDGSGRPLTDKYSFSNITSLRLVSFN